MAGTAVATAGMVRLKLHCGLCGSTCHNVLIDAVVDDDGDLAFDTRQLAVWVYAHRQPMHELVEHLPIWNGSEWVAEP